MRGQKINHLFAFGLKLNKPGGLTLLLVIRAKVVASSLNQSDLREQVVTLALFNDLLDVVRETRPGRSFGKLNILDPLDEVTVTVTLGDDQSIIL